MNHMSNSALPKVYLLKETLLIALIFRLQGRTKDKGYFKYIMLEMIKKVFSVELYVFLLL